MRFYDSKVNARFIRDQGQGGNVNTPGTGTFQCPGAGFNGRPVCYHIVDQQNVLILDLGQSGRRYRKCALEIAPALISRETDLRNRPLSPDESAAGDLPTGSGRQDSCDDG